MPYLLVYFDIDFLPDVLPTGESMPIVYYTLESFSVKGERVTESASAISASQSDSLSNIEDSPAVSRRRPSSGGRGRRGGKGSSKTNSASPEHGLDSQPMRRRSSKKPATYSTASSASAATVLVSGTSTVVHVSKPAPWASTSVSSSTGDAEKGTMGTGTTSVGGVTGIGAAGGLGLGGGKSSQQVQKNWADDLDSDEEDVGLRTTGATSKATGSSNGGWQGGARSGGYGQRNYRGSTAASKKV